MSDLSPRQWGKGDEARERIKECLDRFQLNHDRMFDPASSEDKVQKSIVNNIHFFSYVTLLEEIRRTDPERAAQLNEWIGDMFEDEGAAITVYQWRKELAEGRDLSLPAPPAQSSQDAPKPSSPVSLDRAREATPMCCDERDALQRRIDKALAEIGQWWGTAQRGDRVLMVVNSILRGQVDEPTEPSTSDLSGRWVGGQFQPFQPGEGPS